MRRAVYGSAPASRSLGEAGRQASNVNAANALSNLPLLLHPASGLASDPALAFEGDEPAGRCEVTYGGSKEPIAAAQVLGALLGQMRRHAEKAADGRCISRWVLAAPAAVGEAGKAALLDAAVVAGLGGNDHVDVVDSLDAAASGYAPTHRAQPGEPAKRVLLVDVGHAFTTAGVYELPAEGVPTRLSLASELVGARDLDRALWKKAAEVLQAKHGESVAPRSKSARRLMTAVVAAKKVLSTILQATIDLECFGEAEKDYRIPVTRVEFESACAEHITKIEKVVADALLASGGGDIAAVEGIGGATRVPCVVAAVAKAAGVPPPLGRMLDSASCVGQGAVFIAQAEPKDRPFAPAKEAPVVRAGCADEVREAVRSHTARASTEALAAFVAREEAMHAADEALAARGEAFNAVEAYVLDMKGAMSGSEHGTKLEPARQLLDDAEDWLYSDEADAANTEALATKLAEVKAAVEERCADYFAAVAEDKAKLEAELKAQAEAEAARVAVEGKDDHDQRRLKFPDRLEKLQKCKAEGTSHFKDGNLQLAIDFYHKALAHADKFVDLSPDQKQEVNAVSLNLHMNVALANLKLGTEVGLKRCEEAATAALAIDATNSKALYRRAAAREKRGAFAEAKADLEKTEAAAPGDSAVAALHKRVLAQIARQRKKEQQMAQRMFG